MDLRALRYFSEVIKLGGFTRAAQALCVTQPTISKMVRLLEDELGVPLLVRGRRSTRPTEAGRLVDRYAQQILHLLNGLRTDIDGLKGLVNGELRLGVPPVDGSGLLIQQLKRYHERYPGVGLTIREYLSEQLVESVLSGEMDLGVTAGPLDDGIFESLPLYRGRLGLVVPSNSRWAGQTVNLADLAGQDFVGVPETSILGKLFDQACRDQGFSPQLVCRTTQWKFLSELVEAGLGLAPMPTVLGERLASSGLGLAAMVPEIWYNLVLIWRRGGMPCFATKAFVDLTRATLAEGIFPAE